MTPSHSRKSDIKYRYYISAQQVGPACRIPASEVESEIAKAVRTKLGAATDTDDQTLITEHVVRVEVQAEKLVVQLANTKGPSRKRIANLLEIPWRKTSSKRRREILIPESQNAEHVRPIRSENRATLVAAIARARRWLEELIANPDTNAESIASRERCTVRQVNMTISLAFLAPDLVKAAIEGRLPHGMGVRRLRDMPSDWQKQRQVLGL